MEGAEGNVLKRKIKEESLLNEWPKKKKKQKEKKNSERNECSFKRIKNNKFNKQERKTKKVPLIVIPLFPIAKSILFSNQIKSNHFFTWENNKSSNFRAKYTRIYNTHTIN